ncbi:unnamed protein product [Plutella xylostella]|uniref:(diamondback moth) hypothetical protein n=1 Tax=Plutella xylostella TaxID=51655 RepID=A0A8S4G0C4_PLUXY|nr:unnamed protein product [Plutella xylostella]
MTVLRRMWPMLRPLRRVRPVLRPLRPALLPPPALLLRALLQVLQSLHHHLLLLHEDLLAVARLSCLIQVLRRMWPMLRPLRRVRPVLRPLWPALLPPPALLRALLQVLQSLHHHLHLLHEDFYLRAPRSSFHVEDEWNEDLNGLVEQLITTAASSYQ